MNHNFYISNVDTDSISFYKEDGAEFTTEERVQLLKELNSLFPDGLLWEDDGYYTKFIVLKAKNYILYDGKKIKLKGSALKSATLEPALKEFLNKVIDAIIHENANLQDIYLSYVKEINSVKDIKRWASKKTISEKTLTSERSNETKIVDAIQGSEYVEGDKVYLYFKSDDSLALVEHFDGDYNKERLYKKLFECTKRFATVMDTKSLFINFSLKKNKEKLLQLVSDGGIV